MGPRLSLAVLVLTLVAAGCSKPSNNLPAPGKAMFMGCPITTDGEDFTGGGSAIPKAIFSNSPSKVYAVGVVKTPNSSAPDQVMNQGIVRMSNDGGTTFTTFDQSTGATDNAIVADSSNTNIYVAQTLSGSPTRASIHYTTDGGANWKDIPFQLKGQNNETLVGVVLAPSGQPVFVGTSEKTGFVIKLDLEKNSAVLMQSLENTEFKQVVVQGQDFLVAGSNLSNNTWFLERWSASKNAKLVAESQEKDSKLTPEDIMTKSWIDLSDGFANQLDDATDETFLNLNRFARIYPTELAPILKAANDGAKARAAAKNLPGPTPPPPAPILTGLSGSATAILVTPDNFIFVAGTVHAPTESDAWVVRRSANNGASFTTADLFSDVSFKSLTPNALVNYDNHVLAIGGGKKPPADPQADPQKAPADSHWDVRGAQDRYSSWVTLSTPKFSTDPAESAQAVGGVMTGTGDAQSLIVLGNSHEKDGTHHWRTQKTSSCNRLH